ncbi:BirA family biotin operon repressor/biotin-[acetyl-CoA-carboxylase] ligase [Mesoflavibacter sabulilitoris]|uniref:Biotin--[acetyl-CoA-carboxylase] ligase n=1 Tax=Mesoflavibacter zeaxanthinifaciens subsp. sabulilitoris TaxID=1520893 RepID=A0A2T1NBJ7_9FLAO|nr:biotin--[acetyl-CoA-carboxylase] ligase [Mesoflavibacter zeaxanthinifaciens]MBB3125083.1 BirA family biotin operon repressor/biotin-[acetyl-CoA-carboxylase] ligase [Mesoflavibacter zeaxanthinifaciens subsp. sabulilitoris]PSG89799.1 biotin--[acetyl-CoA-carboxylase] ligase [Mesoflavibacter zeaxanthinifaciens subsp. sabulilitoris]
MRIIKLNAIDSTNLFLRSLSIDTNVEDFTVVVAKHQTKGRGQMGTVWSSQDAKNLTFSVFKRLVNLKLDQHFVISMVASLAVINTLKKLNLPKLSVKWPNDILSANKKICGILIENVIKQNNVSATVVGIGLNVNQVNFSNLPQASSLLNVTGISYDLDELLQSILKELEILFDLVESNHFKTIKTTYESYLFRKDKPSTFKNEEGLFSGFIKGVSNEGLLEVLLEDNILKTFDLKTIKLLY